MPEKKRSLAKQPRAKFMTVVFAQFEEAVSFGLTNVVRLVWLAS